MYYVYILKNPLKDSQPFYVGKGKGYRCSFHIKSAVREWRESFKNLHKSNTIRNINKAGGEVLIEIVFEGSEKECFLIERKLIAEYGIRSRGGILTNQTYGGEGNTKPGIQVDQYDMFDNYIKTFDTIQAASDEVWQNNNGKSSIKQCCLGERRSAGGYRWAFYGESIKNTCANKRKVVYKFDRSLKLVDKYRSINSIPIVDASTITLAIRNETISYDHFWSFDKSFIPKNRNLYVCIYNKQLTYYYSIQQVKRAVPFRFYYAKSSFPVIQDGYEIYTNTDYIQRCKSETLPFP